MDAAASVVCRPQPAIVGRSVRSGARQSIPSSSMTSWASVNAAAPAVDGQMKRPFSRRLANRHRPWPSHYSTLIRWPCRPRNTKALPENGSRARWSWTRAASDTVILDNVQAYG